MLRFLKKKNKDRKLASTINNRKMIAPRKNVAIKDTITNRKKNNLINGLLDDRNLKYAYY